MDERPAPDSEEGSAWDRGMAVGAFVLLVASFRPWFDSVSSSGIASKTAWTGSPMWCAAVLTGIVAALVWFGALRGFSERSRRLVSAGLLLAGLGVLAAQWWRMHVREVLVIMESYVSLEDYRADLQLGHHVAAGALLAMFVIAATAAATSLRRGGGRPHDEG